MKDTIKLLSMDGRTIAINKHGYWHCLDGVGLSEFGQALQQGDVEEIIQDPEVSNADLIDFAVTIGICLVILFSVIFLFNTSC